MIAKFHATIAALHHGPDLVALTNNAVLLPNAIEGIFDVTFVNSSAAIVDHDRPKTQFQRVKRRRSWKVEQSFKEGRKVHDRVTQISQNLI